MNKPNQESPRVTDVDTKYRQMIDFLISKVLWDPEAQIHEDTPLISSGLVDSFALVEVLTELERVTSLRIPSGRVSPQDLDTVRKMLQIAARWGKPKS